VSGVTAIGQPPLINMMTSMARPLYFVLSFLSLSCAVRAPPFSFTVLLFECSLLRALLSYRFVYFVAIRFIHQ
jgi:hypothetical protein